MNALTYVEQDHSIRASLVEDRTTIEAQPVPERMLPARGLVLGVAASAVFWILLAVIVAQLV